MDKYIQKLRVALAIHGIAAWVVALMTGGALLQMMVWLILRVLVGTPTQGYMAFAGLVMLPADPVHFAWKPWTLFTWPWFAPLYTANLVFYVVMAGLFVWMFAKVHQQLLGDAHTRRVVLMAVPLTGLLTVLISGALGSGSNEYVAGISPLAVTLMVSAVALVPNYPIELVFLGPVRLWMVGAVSLIILLIGAGDPFSPNWIAISSGAVLGALHILMLKRYGTDVPLWIGERLSRLAPAQRQQASPRKREQVRTTTTPPPHREPGLRQQTAPNTETPSQDFIPQDVIDQILDKISASGYDSLSKKEKELLFKASNQNP